MYYKTDYESHNINSFSKEELDKCLEQVLIFINKRMIKTFKGVSINNIESYIQSLNPTKINIHYWTDGTIQNALLHLTNV